MEYRLQIKGVNTSWMTLNTYTDAALAQEYLDSLRIMAGPGWHVRLIGSDGNCFTQIGGLTMQKITDRLRARLEQAADADLLAVDITETASGDVCQHHLSKGQILACLRLACVARLDVAE